MAKTNMEETVAKLTEKELLILIKTLVGAHDNAVKFGHSFESIDELMTVAGIELASR